MTRKDEFLEKFKALLREYDAELIEAQYKILPNLPCYIWNFEVVLDMEEAKKTSKIIK
jgi:hypothetical protein